MEILAASHTAISRAIEILLAGGIAAYPTETFYGLGAKFDNARAVERIYTIKHRPQDKALPVIIANHEQLSLLTGSIPEMAETLISTFWPGPLTLILHARPGLTEGIVHERKVAVRMPGPSFALDLVTATGFPITSTSANPTGMPPARNSGMIIDYFSLGIDLVVDGGEAASRRPSTIVDLCGELPRIVRDGAIPQDHIFSTLR